MRTLFTSQLAAADDEVPLTVVDRWSDKGSQWIPVLLTSRSSKMKTSHYNLLNRSQSVRRHL